MGLDPDVSFNKEALEEMMNKPFMAINHLEGHIFSNFLACKNLDYPFICLLVSGGHTQLWLICGIGNYKLLENCSVSQP